MRTFAAIALVLAATSGAAIAEDVTPEAKAGIEKALTEAGCTPIEMAKTDTGYNADAKCADGEYEVQMDSSFKITEKKK